MMFTLEQFETYRYSISNRDKIHITFGEVISSFYGESDEIHRTLETILGAKKFIDKKQLNLLKSLNLYSGITDELEDFIILISIPDFQLFKKEEIIPLNGYAKGIAFRQTRNIYTGNHTKIVAFGIVLGLPFSEGYPALFLKVTASFWLLFTRTLIQMYKQDNNVFVDYKEHSFYPSHYIFEIPSLNLRVYSTMNKSKTSDEQFDIYFFPRQ